MKTGESGQMSEGQGKRRPAPLPRWRGIYLAMIAPPHITGVQLEQETIVRERARAITEQVVE